MKSLLRYTLPSLRKIIIERDICNKFFSNAYEKRVCKACRAENRERNFFKHQPI